jgi:hypothetical protein
MSQRSKQKIDDAEAVTDPDHHFRDDRRSLGDGKKRRKLAVTRAMYNMFRDARRLAAC